MNEFVIKNGYISQNDSIVNGSLTAGTVFISTTPSVNNSNTEILSRNTTTGKVEFTQLSAVTVSSDYYVTGGTYSDGTLTLNRQNGSVTVSGFFTGGTTQDTYVTGFTYDNESKLTISQQGQPDLTAYINTFSGITVNGNIILKDGGYVKNLQSSGASLNLSSGNFVLLSNNSAPYSIIDAHSTYWEVNTEFGSSSSRIFGSIDPVTGGLYINQYDVDTLKNGIYIVGGATAPADNNMSDEVGIYNYVQYSGITSIGLRNKEIYIADNTIKNVSSPDSHKHAVIIGSSGSTMLAGVINSAIIGGFKLTGSSNNTLYTQNLNVNGSVTIPTGAQNGYVLTSNANGVATWQSPSAGSDSYVSGATYDTGSGLLTLTLTNGKPNVTVTIPQGSGGGGSCLVETTATTVSNEQITITNVSGLVSGGSYMLESYVTAYKDGDEYGFWKRTVGVTYTGTSMFISYESADFDNQVGGLSPSSVSYAISGDTLQIRVSGYTGSQYYWVSNHEVIGNCDTSSSSSVYGWGVFLPLTGTTSSDGITGNYFQNGDKIENGYFSSTLTTGSWGQKYNNGNTAYLGYIGMSDVQALSDYGLLMSWETGDGSSYTYFRIYNDANNAKNKIDIGSIGGDFPGITYTADFSNNYGAFSIPHVAFNEERYFKISAYTDTYVTGLTYSNNTLTLSQNEGQPNITTTIPDIYVTGVTYSNNTLTLYRNEGQSDLTTTIPDYYITGGTYADGTLTLNRQNGSVIVTGFLTGSTGLGSDYYVTGATYSSGTLVLGRQNGEVSVTGFTTGMKSNTVAGGSFAGNPKKYSVVFTSPYPSSNYSISISAAVARSFTWEVKTSTGFTINSNANTTFTENVDWITMSFGEF